MEMLLPAFSIQTMGGPSRCVYLVVCFLVVVNVRDEFSLNLTKSKAPYLSQFNWEQIWHEPTRGVIFFFSLPSVKLNLASHKQICSGHGFKVRPIGTLHLVECRIADPKSFFFLWSITMMWTIKRGNEKPVWASKDEKTLRNASHRPIFITCNSWDIWRIVKE